jgi:hypothetical protein
VGGAVSNAGGAATAAASATVSRTAGSASATATSTGGVASAGISPSGAATASANARNVDGAALTSASGPAGSSALAVTNATVTNLTLGSGSAQPVGINAGRTVSNAILTQSGLTQPGSAIVVGAMSAGYGVSGVLAARSGLAVTYEATATFDFSTPVEALNLELQSDKFADTSAGIAFDSLDLEVLVNGTALKNLPFYSLTGSSGAETFFMAHPTIGLGTIAAGQSIEIEYLLGYKSGTSAAPGDGFGFTYALADPPASSAAIIPEPSTWAMMLVGFAGLAWAGHRASRTSATKST